MDRAIEVEGLTRRFGDLLAVDHVHFAVNEGEVFGFLGPNGAGKTTTVRMMTGVIDPTEGTARIEGHDILREPLRAREHIAVVPEEANVYPDLSVWQNLMLMAELYSVRRATRHERGERLLERLGLADRRDEKARTLSKGLRQRLMLCCALVTGPQLLFLDEPTSGLDVRSSRLIRDIVADMNADGLTVFLTTHNMDEAEEMSDRLAIINKGRIVATDTPEALRDAVESSRSVVVSFDGEGPEPEDLRALSDVERVSRDGDGYRIFSPTPGAVATDVVRLADREGLSIREIQTQRPTLEDVFMQLTAEGHGEDAA